MKKHRSPLIMLTLLAISLSSPIVYATDAVKDPASHHPQTAPADAPPSEEMVQVDMKKYLQEMQATLLKMHDLSHKIQQTKNAKEQEKFKDEHLQLMGRHMEMVAPLMMQMMMGSGGHGGEMGEEEESADQAPNAESPPHKH